MNNDQKRVLQGTLTVMGLIALFPPLVTGEHDPVFSLSSWNAVATGKMATYLFLAAIAGAAAWVHFGSLDSNHTKKYAKKLFHFLFPAQMNRGEFFTYWLSSLLFFGLVLALAKGTAFFFFAVLYGALYLAWVSARVRDIGGNQHKWVIGMGLTIAAIPVPFLSSSYPPDAPVGIFLWVWLLGHFYLLVKKGTE